MSKHNYIYICVHFFVNPTGCSLLQAGYETWLFVRCQGAKESWTSQLPWSWYAPVAPGPPSTLRWNKAQQPQKVMPKNPCPSDMSTHPVTEMLHAHVYVYTYIYIRVYKYIYIHSFSVIRCPTTTIPPERRLAYVIKQILCSTSNN